MSWKRMASEAVVLMIAAIFLGAAANSLRSGAHKLAWFVNHRMPEQSSQPSTTARPEAEPKSAPSGDPLLAMAPAKDPALLFLDISGDVALRLHGAGALFLDARRSSAYEQGHIAKALNIPVWEHDADERVAALREKGAQPGQVFVIYCSGGTCEDGPRLAEKLAFAGFINVYLYKDGYPDWQSKGRPVSLGKQP
jgi:rhodanese-related sulfurtransferase